MKIPSICDKETYLPSKFKIHETLPYESFVVSDVEHRIRVNMHNTGSCACCTAASTRSMLRTSTLINMANHTGLDLSLADLICNLQQIILHSELKWDSSQYGLQCYRFHSLAVMNNASMQSHGECSLHTCPDEQRLGERTIRLNALKGIIDKFYRDSRETRTYKPC